MKLGDLRKLAIRQQTRIRFPLANGMECVVNEHGVAQVPALKNIADFNLEQELVAVRTFQLDSLPTDPKIPVKSRTLRREELAALTNGSPATAETHDHDDE
jgi:hypothetical protein